MKPETNKRPTRRERKIENETCGYAGPRFSRAKHGERKARHKNKRRAK